MNRLEKKENRKRKLADALHGTGLYVFENNTKATLILSKPLKSNKNRIEPGEQFQGDSYYNQLIGNGLKLIKTIHTEEGEMPEKLLLDQPDRYTVDGPTEQVVAKPKVKPLNERLKKQKDTLLTEEPISGLEIIME